MNAKPPPVDYLQVAPYSRRDLVFHWTGGLLNLLVAVTGIVYLVATWRVDPPLWPWLLVAILAGFYAADLMSGLLHWAFDTWFNEGITFIRRMVIMVREHHIYPNRIFQFSFYHDAGVLAWIGMIVILGPVLWAVFLADRGSPLAGYAVLTALVFDLLLIFMLEFHKCGHRPDVPVWVRLLQRCGLLLSFRHHVRHHRGNHDCNYCLINGWADLTLGRLGFFRGLELAIHKLTGAVPQQNDHEWLRLYGRPVFGRGGRSRMAANP